MQRVKHPTYLYAAASGPYIKIGISTRPFSRVKTVTTPRSGLIAPKVVISKPCRAVHVVRGTCKDERALHAALSVHRVDGEWFDLSCMEDPAYRKVFEQRPPVSVTETRGHTIPVHVPRAVHRAVCIAATLEGRLVGEFAADAVLAAVKRSNRKKASEARKAELKKFA